MNDELIERLAREAGIADPGDVFLPAGLHALARFAALVAEQCARAALSTRPPRVDMAENPSMACFNKLTIYRSESVARIHAAFPMPKD